MRVHAVLLLFLAAAAPATGDVLTVERRELPEAVLRWRRSLPEDRPALRGYRAELALGAEAAYPAEPLPPAPPFAGEALREAQDVVARTLAGEGLLLTAARVLERLGAARFADGIDAAEARLLWLSGLPVDWLDAFPTPGGQATAEWIAGRLLERGDAATIAGELDALAFRFRPSLAGFEVATESGEHAIGALRLQLTSGSYWSGAGDGGAVDVLRQLAVVLPDVPFRVGIEERFVEPLQETAGGWGLERPARIALLVEPLVLSQWAQDNGKCGLAPNGAGRAVVTLVPRYASRGEDGALHVPGETFAVEALAAHGERVVQSPLLFQGGNLLPVRDPRTGERVLLLGEAEVARNRSLGLSEAEVLEAFRLELGVDRVLVLPAASFHVDYEVTLRAVGGELVAFVNDADAARRGILRCALDALEEARQIDPASAREAREHLAAGNTDEFMLRFGPVVMRNALGFGRFPEAFAEHFSVGPSDSGVGNLQRVLLAMDGLAAEARIPDEALDPDARAYLAAARRLAAARAELVDVLRAQGWRIEPVPGLSAQDRSLVYVNAIQGRDRLLMPAWGGLFAPVDAEAQRRFEAAVGPGVKVFPVLCSETERRSGGLHCAVAVEPRP